MLLFLKCLTRSFSWWWSCDDLRSLQCCRMSVILAFEGCRRLQGAYVPAGAKKHWMGMLQPSPAEVGSSGNAQPVHCEAIVWRAELCQGEALVLLPCCQGVSSWGISSVTLMLLFPSSNASSLEEEFWIKLLSSRSKEWKKRRKKSRPAGCEAARAVPGGSAGVVAMWDPALARSHGE